MEHEGEIIDPEVPLPAKKGRRSDGGVYLVMADESEEFPVALRYAARLAQNNRGHLAVLYVADMQDFQHWSGIESQMRKELREQAEMYIWDIAKKINDLNDMIPVLYIGEGNRKDVLVDVINEDLGIKMLVLAAGSGPTGPGPLVSYFSGKGLNRLRVPLVLVPGHIEMQKIDAIA